MFYIKISGTASGFIRSVRIIITVSLTLKNTGCPSRRIVHLYPCHLTGMSVLIPQASSTQSTNVSASCQGVAQYLVQILRPLTWLKAAHSFRQRSHKSPPIWQKSWQNSGKTVCASCSHLRRNPRPTFQIQQRSGCEDSDHLSDCSDT